jgi:WD40 repeat protein
VVPCSRLGVTLALLLSIGWASCASVPAAAGPRPKPGPKRPAGAVPAAAPAAIGANNAERVKLVWEADAGGAGRAVAVHRALSRVIVAAGSAVGIYDLRTAKRTSSLPACREVLRGGISFSANKLVVVCESGLELYDAAKLTRLTGPKVASAPATAVAIVGSRVAVGHRDGVVRVYSLEGLPAIEIAVPGPPIDAKSLDVTRDGGKIAVAWVQGSIWWWNTGQPGEPHDLVRRDNESDSLAFSHDGTLLAEEGRNNFTTLWSFGEKPVEKATLRNGAWVKRLRFTRDGKWLVRGGSDGLELAEVIGPRRIALDSRGAVEDVAFDENAATLAAADRDGRLTVWAPR